MRLWDRLEQPFFIEVLELELGVLQHAPKKSFLFRQQMTLGCAWLCMLAGVLLL